MMRAISQPILKQGYSLSKKRPTFNAEDPKEKMEKWFEQLRKKQQQLKKYIENNKQNMFNQFNPQNLKNNKKFYAAVAFVAVAYGLYELKREKAIKLTVEEVLEAIRKTQANMVQIVKEYHEPREEMRQNAVHTPRIQTERTIYIKIDAVSYYAYVKNVDMFYQKVEEIEKNKIRLKVKMVQKQKQTIDRQFIRFFSAVNKVLISILIPFMLFNSSLAKIFKKNVLGQLQGLRPNVHFKDIAGLGNAKIEISQLVDFLQNPSKYRKIGAKVPKGALLSGPPGTGKTMLAKACAGEANVPFFSVSGSEFVELYAGMGATRVRDLFNNAKKQTPAIIFIDQIDAIGRKRDDKFGGAHDQRANTLNQLLVEMDGFGTSEDIIILAATNRKQMLDNALTRPGRFDRIVEIELPDIKGRQQILEIYLKKIKLSPSQTMAEYAKRLATLTYGFSGADIANLCNQAAILAVRKEKSYVESTDFQSASDRVLAGLETNLHLSEKERKRVAYHECGHAVVSWFSEGASPLLKITIVPRSKGSLGFAQYLPNESSLMNKKQLRDQLCIILGGRMSEEHFFNQVTNGAADDLQKVRKLARAIIINYGMSDDHINYAPVETQGQNVYSEQTAQMIDKEIINLIEQCTIKTRKIINLYSDKIEKLAEAVLKKEALNHQEIKEILGQRPFEVKQNYKEFLENISTQTTKFDYVK